MLSLIPYLTTLALATVSFAQFPPNPEGITIKRLQNDPNVFISYKQTFICETKARGWAGYVNMPTSYLSDIETAEPYNISMFFWYFEARVNPGQAPTAIYLAGGPGEPSVAGAASDGGPCTVLHDSNTTASNPWSWNTNVNMLYIDQPVSTGFSYTKKVKGTLDLLFLGLPPTETGITPLEAYDGSVPPENSTFLYGTFSEQNPQKTANGTVIAAKTLWHFCQAWFSSFPEYKTTNKNINIFGNSYGGFYVPVLAEHILNQNSLISSNSLKGSSSAAAIPLHIDTVGWTNGCVDTLIQGEWYPDQAYNNTYGLEVIPRSAYLEAKNNFTKPGGCRDLITQCRSLGELHDPEFLNSSPEVNSACEQAILYCFQNVLGAYSVYSNRSAFDMAHNTPDPFPATNWNGYFNRGWVQKALGVPVNLTAYSVLDNNVFTYLSGDIVRIPGIKSVNCLLERGVKVAMIYGDRDYRCPWNGAEKLSLAAEWKGKNRFAEAGYEGVVTNGTYKGGVVRQYGGLSFARVFEAGHDAQAYQPETVFRLFNRAIFNKDLATGKVTTTTTGAGKDYSSTGPNSSFGIKNKLPSPPPAVDCNIYNVLASCTVEQYLALQNGTAKIVDFNVVKPAGGSPGAITGLI